jgi:hypothetical protein
LNIYLYTVCIYHTVTELAYRDMLVFIKSTLVSK